MYTGSCYQPPKTNTDKNSEQRSARTDPPTLMTKDQNLNYQKTKSKFFILNNISKLIFYQIRTSEIRSQKETLI